MKKLHLPFAGILFLFLVFTGAQAQSFVKKSTPKLSMGDSQASLRTTSHVDHPMLTQYQVWDTTNSVWNDIWQLTTTYLSNGERAETIRATWQGASYINSSRTLYGYDSHDNLGLLLDFTWAGTWMQSERTTLLYDQFDNQTLVVNESYNGSSFDTTYGFRSTFTYVNTNKISTVRYEDWDDQTQQWGNFQMNTYHYDSNLRLDSLSSSYWVGSNWQFYSRYGYAWNTSNEWDTVTTDQWTGSAWAPQEREVGYQWHDFSNHLSSFYRTQSYQSGWVDVSRNSTAYGANNSSVEIKEYYNTTWDSAAKFVRTYNSHDDLSAYENYHYTTGWDLDFGTHYHYTYDLFGHTEESYTDVATGTAPYVNSEKWIYASFFTGMEATSAPMVSIKTYPNPTANELHFDLSLKKNGPVHIGIYDLQGRLRAETSVRYMGSEIIVPISDVLENGSYTYRLGSKEGEATGKFVVQR